MTAAFAFLCRKSVLLLAFLLRVLGLTFFLLLNFHGVGLPFIHGVEFEIEVDGGEAKGEGLIPAGHVPGEGQALVQHGVH